MLKFFHELPEARELFETLAAEMNILPVVIEKDYWLTHCLWGLNQQGLEFELKGGTSLSKGWRCIDRFSEDVDIRFNPPEGLNTSGEKPLHIKARFAFYDELAVMIKILGMSVERSRTYDDTKAQNGGIGLKYDSFFSVIPGLKPEILLEVGFAKTAPNEPINISSWVIEKALKAKLDVIDNRAVAVKCFNPEYTFIDKLQTICRRFRQYRDRNDPEKDRPRQFLRHYYDLFKLLEVERVNKFIGTAEYEEYKMEKLRGLDAKEFATRRAFSISDDKTWSLFEKEFEPMKSLLLSPGPTFKEIMDRLRMRAGEF